MSPSSETEARFALRSRRVVTPEGVRAATVLVDAGTIAAVQAATERLPAGLPVTDLGDHALLPGLIDIHVHANEPGRTEWEGLETATRAAAAGGITLFVDMPLNSAPVTTTVPALEEKIAAAHRPGALQADVGFWAGLVPGNAAQIAPLLDAGALGAKAFLVHSGIDDFPAATEADLRAAMPILAAYGAPLLVHAELPAPETTPFVPADPRAYRDYLASRPPDWELDAIRLVLDLCAEYRCRVHIVHLAAAEALPALVEARASGLPVTVETCPHYLHFDAAGIPDGDTRFKCAPPIRDAENRERLWEALRDGTIDLVASDHSPCPPAMKGLDHGDFFRAWGGIASLQLLLPVLWTGAAARGFDLSEMTRWLSAQPALLSGQAPARGAIVPGARADLVVFDPDAEFTVDGDRLYHRHPVTPYAGERLREIVEQTLLHGVSAYNADSFPAAAGAPILGRTTL